MLTRAQVAKRLGKSIATVRRLEGVALYPVVDANGVHWFHPDGDDDVDLLEAVINEGFK